MLDVNKEKCTGCGACRDVCPKQCITLQPDSLGAIYPIVETEVCIKCGICVKTCPIERPLEFHNPIRVYAAWSNSAHVRLTSASGGIAYELYRYWIQKGGVATGVVYERAKGCHFVLLEKESDIRPTQNSKYTFSDTDGIYKVVKEKLEAGFSVLFIGVPCQVAGLYGFLKKRYNNLVTVDIVCHGMPPATYLKQHIESIENKKDEHTSELYFRDPKYHTNSFTFTLRNKEGKEFYNKKVLSTDNYQLGYHRALIYRENCYHCRYARRERISDLTISDFFGLGRFAPCNFEKNNISCVTPNTSVGLDIIQSIDVILKDRPMEEAFNVEKQLQHPSSKHLQREKFEKEYKMSKSYNKAATKALKKEKVICFIARVNKILRTIIKR